jgi:hypothetical protein
MNTGTKDQGSARPVFRLLAIPTAVSAWLMFIVSASDIDAERTAIQEYWVVVLCLFVAVLFSVAAIRGKVPRWLYRMIPHSRSWESRDHIPRR